VAESFMAFFLLLVSELAHPEEQPTCQQP